VLRTLWPAVYVKVHLCTCMCQEKNAERIENEPKVLRRAVPGAQRGAEDREAGGSCANKDVNLQASLFCKTLSENTFLVRCLCKVHANG